MKFSEHWLRSLVDPPLDSEALGDALTMAGLEVEHREPVAPEFTGVVVGKVLTVVRHPNADRLSLCTVDVGKASTLSIVCGAPNVVAEATVACAMVGSRLPGGIDIRQTAVRGVDSQGMLCSAKELGLSDDASGLLILDADIAPGADLRQVLDLDDTLITLKLTPNRSDCLSMLGLAREVGAITMAPVSAMPRSEIVSTFKPERGVSIESPTACPRFCARVIRGIDARAPTPEWIKRRIERSGVRSISAIVDITNYVMLELGQPLHAYDDAVLQGDLVVRFPRQDEKLLLLNGQDLDLTPDLLLVADQSKPLGLAGIMGGEASAITDATTSVFLEGAFWNPSVIQGKGRRLGFATDAGFRFERGVDFANAAAAVDRATKLILHICGGEASELLDIESELPRRDSVRVRSARIARVLGVTIPDDTVDGIFARLGLSPVRDGDGFVVTPPSYRFDLAIEEDFIEEAARLYGFDRIFVSRVVHAQSVLPSPERARTVRALKHALVGRDYQEVITFSFVDAEWERAFGISENPIKVLNPIAAHLGVMRTTMLGGLLDTLRSNLNRKHDRVRLFEMGRCFLRDGERYVQPMRLGGLAFGPALPEQWAMAKRPVDFFDVKSDVAALLAPASLVTNAAAHPALHPGRSAHVSVGGARVGWMGELHPRLVREFSLTAAPVVFEIDVAALLQRGFPAPRQLSRHPVVRRDLGVVVREDVPAQALVDALIAVKPDSVDDIRIFDMYRGPGVPIGMKSLAILVLIQDTERTLTDAQIDGVTGILVGELERSFGATLRK